MNICVAGWYYHPKFMATLDKVSKKYPATIVAHRPNTYSDSVNLDNNINCIIVENKGLEWHMYDYYLRNVWDGRVPVLFTHDDNVLAESFFDRVASEGRVFDVAFIFRDENEARINGRAHGRAIYMSPRFLSIFKPLGFWYDAGNFNETSAPRCNAGIQHFLQDVNWVSQHPNTHDIKVSSLIIPDIDLGYRGLVGDDGERYRREHFR